MCGRYVLEPSLEFERQFGVRLAPRYNIAPGTDIPVVTGPASLEEMRWGLLPAWMKRGRGIVNVRSETVLEKPAFRALFETARCLVPASGYYEWRHGDSAPQPFFIRPVDGGMTSFAALYEDAPEGRRCAVLTTASTALLAPVHDRMPVMLDPDAARLWLDPSATVEALLACFAPSVPVTMHAVSPRVNRVQEDGAELIVPMEDDAPPRLF